MLFRHEALEARRTKLYGDIIVVSPVSFKLVTIFIISIVICVGVFLATGTFARSETVSGRVVPSAGVVQVFPASSGLLEDFDVEENQSINKGEVLGRISVMRPALGEGTPGAATLHFVEEQLEVIVEQIVETKRLSELETTELEQQSTDIRQRIILEQEQLLIQSELLSELEKILARATDLASQQLSSVQIVDQRRVDMLRQRQQEQSNRGSIVELRADLAKIERQKNTLPINLNLKFANLNAQRNDLIRQQQELTSSSSYNIIAPVSGRASTLLALNGREVQPGRPLFSILPETSELEVELYVPSRAVGFIEKGQTVRILFDAFPYQRFGSQNGEIKSITSSVISPNDDAVPFAISEPVYRVTVALESDYVNAYGRTFPIQSGMMLKANIILERRSFLVWLLEPLQAVARRT